MCKVSQAIFLGTGGGGGTVTQLNAGTGITLTPSPITTSGTIALTIPVVISSGGTNATSMANTNGVVYYDGTRLVTTTVGTAGQQLVSNGIGLAPTFQTAGTSTVVITGDSGGPLTSHSFTFTGGTSGLSFSGSGTTETLSGTLVVANGGTGNTTFTPYSVITAGTTATGAFGNVSGVGTLGQILTSQGATALPQWANAAVAFTWSVITVNQTAVVNNGYICNKAGLLTLLLPATSAVGTLLEVTGMNTALGWQITQGAGQQIFFGTSTTTIGTGGSLASTAIYDSVRLVCNVANTSWIAISSIGSPTIT